MNFSEIIKTPGRRITPKVYFCSGDVEQYISQDDFIQCKIYYNANLVGTLMQSMELELKSQLPDTSICFEITAKYGTDIATKTYGPYFLKEKPTYNADSKTYTHKLCDSFVKTMTDYKPLTITYPTNVFNFFVSLCSACGLTTNIQSLPNGSRIMASDIYDGISYTNRDVFDDISQATGTPFKIVGTEVEKATLGTEEIEINDDILKNQNIAFGQHFGPINSIVLSRGAGADNIYKRDETLTSWNEFKIKDNQLMNNNDRSDYLDELYNALHGIEYDIYDTELIGYGGFEPFSKIKISTIKDGITYNYNSYVLNDEQTITQGYTETIYTPLPEEAKTDYNTASSTDKAITQANLKVDKQNQKITSLTSQVTSNTEKTTSLEQSVNGINANITSINTNVNSLSTKTTQLTADVNELRGEIGDITDITITLEGTGSLNFTGINESEPINISVHPNSDKDISYLYPSSKLYPSSTLYPRNRILRFTNTTNNINYDLILPGNLRYYNGVYDEFVLDYENQIFRIIRRIGINADYTKYLLQNEVNEDYTFQVLSLKDGDYTVTILGYPNSYLKVRLMSKNMYTAQFATKVELHSSITETADSINLEVSKKVGKDEIISKINLTTESATIDAPKININGVLNAINNNTTTTINGNKITTGSITASQVASDIITTNNFSAQNINANKITTGTLNGNNVSIINLSASNITSGTLSADKISGGTINGNNVNVTNLNANNITGGSLNADRISGGTISSSSISIGGNSYYLRMGTDWTNHPSVSGLNVGGGGINMGNSGISRITGMSFSGQGSISTDTWPFVFYGPIKATGIYLGNGGFTMYGTGSTSETMSIEVAAANLDYKHLMYFENGILCSDTYSQR